MQPLPQEILIETPRLWLRTMRATDLEGLLAVFSDPKVMAAFHSPPFTRHQMQNWLQRNLDHQAQYGYGLFSVLLKQNGTLIGDCGLEMMEVNGEAAAELGYDFGSDYWNRGYATEAASSVRDYAFQQLRLPRLISLVRTGNIPSKRVAEKIGMSFTAGYQNGTIQYWKYELEARNFRTQSA
jgi:RimJ/RimL family protein N-acetyltransferase